MFLGLANYFRSYVPNYSQVASPLYKLTRASSLWRKGPLPQEAYQAFRFIQDSLVEAVTLAYPTREGQFHLFVDASSGKGDKAGREGGLGACLMQMQKDGSRRPVGFASRKLKSHENNYSAFMLELLACVYGIDFFSTYPGTTLYPLHRPQATGEAQHGPDQDV